jgi:hypothetical protein
VAPVTVTSSAVKPLTHSEKVMVTVCVATRPTLPLAMVLAMVTGTGPGVRSVALAAMRKPWSRKRLAAPGELKRRPAARQKRMLLCQLPPRTTRFAPVAGPAGSVCGVVG